MYQTIIDELKSLPSNAQIATIKTITVPRIKKDGPRNVLKHARTQVLLNTSYERAINKILGQAGEPHYTPGPRKWGRRIQGTCLVEHLGAYYLETQPIKLLDEKYFTPDGELPKNEVEPYLNKREELLKWRDYSLNSIIEIRVANKILIPKKEA